MCYKAYGKNNQLVFQTEDDFFQAIGICTNSNVVSITYEPNKKTGSYGDAYRIRKLASAKVLPDYFEKIITTNNRINCNGFIQDLISQYGFLINKSLIKGTLEDVLDKIPSNRYNAFLDGFTNYFNEKNKNDIIFSYEKVKNTNLTEAKIPINKHGLNKKTKRINKLDYSKMQRINENIGKFGERLVFKMEKEKLDKLFRDKKITKKLIPEWISLYDDSVGYDIKSYDKLGNEIYIEVKTTTGNKLEPFFISKKELEFSTAHPQNYLLYRVFNLRKETPSFFRLTGDISKCNNIDISELDYIVKIK